MQETRISDLNLVAHGTHVVRHRTRSRQRVEARRRELEPARPDPADARRRSQMGGKSMKRHYGVEEPMVKGNRQ